MSPATIAARPLLLLAATLGISATAALGQDLETEAQARLQGVVVLESTFEPIRDAVVTLVGTDIETRTGRMGEFAIAEPPVGTAWVRVAVPGMPSVREQVQIGPEGIIFLQFQMPEDVSALLAAMTVDVVTGREVPQAQTALDLVAAKVPQVGMRNSGVVGDKDDAVRLRGFSSLTQNGDPLIIIDDVLAQGAPPLELLSRIPATDVESVEILKGPAAAFRYPFASNGVIRVTTRRH